MKKKVQREGNVIETLILIAVIAILCLTAYF